ncbi:MAG: DegT/DnrJ/EryC1/StrS family aminotransferase [Verrucomicrobiales bacterium]
MTAKPIQISQPVTGDEEWRATRDCFASGWLTSGPHVRRFEEAFAMRHHVNHAIAVTSATTALHLALVALGIGPGDEVIVPAFTWVATANVVKYCGATVVFADINLLTFNLDAAEVSKKVSSRTRAIIAVHLFGLCADIDGIRAAAPGIPIIEDAACASGAAYKGRPAGGLGLMGCFSFHPRKSVTTGEGGMLTTDDDDLAEKVSCLRNHGASISEEQRHSGPQPYILPDFNLLGYNYRMTDLQAAVGCVQLAKLDSLITERERWAAYYYEHLRGVAWLRLPNEFLARQSNGNYHHGWQSYVTMIDSQRSPRPRNEIMRSLAAQGISTRPGTHAVHMLRYYLQNMNTSPGDFPVARDANDYSMAIPLHNRMTEDEFARVVDSLRSL